MKPSIAPVPSVRFSERPACPLCGSHDRSVHRAFRDLPVVRCTSCGFLYSSRIMADEGLYAYYRDSFGGKRHLQGQTVNARTNAVALKSLLTLSAVRTWLDVGTGYGILLQWLRRKYKIEAEGVELSQQEAQYAQQLGLPVRCALLSESGLPRDHYDVVSSFEVIEHTPDPIAFLTDMAQYVRPGGQLVVMTDNFESPPAIKLRGSFPKWIPHTHISHFTPSSLQRCIDAVPGLKLEQGAAYTPWDLLAREWLSPFKRPLPDDQAYDMHAVLSTEMTREYRLYRVRHLLNPVWARLHLRKTLGHGALMYSVCRRRP